MHLDGPRAPAACPCGAGPTYAACCAPLHRGEERAATAEQLMRSRYSAFAVGDAAYLERTWDAASRPMRLDLDAGTCWTGLEVLATHAGGPLDRTGVVEFRASYTDHGVAGALHEVSRFARDAHGWRYVDGTTPA